MTKTNSDKMTIAIFIAGEEYGERRGEYSIYKSCFSGIEQKKITESAINNTTTWGSRTLKYIGFKEKDYAVFAVEKNNDLKSITQELNENSNRFTEDNAKKILAFISSILLSIKIDSNNFDVVIFSHWHANEPLQAEVSLNEELGKIPSDKKPEILKEIAVESFSLSSLRKDLFDLEAISVPLTLEEINELKERFIEDRDYRDPNLTLAEAKDKFLSSKKFKLADSSLKNQNSQNQDNRSELILGEGINILNSVNFVLVAAKNIWPILAIKDILKTKLNAKDFSEISSCKSVIPIFISGKNCLGIDYTFGNGLNPPREFIINCTKCENGKWDFDFVVEQINERLNIWDKDGTLSDGVSLEEFRDWVAGSFRKYCFLDERVHGMSGDMNLSEAQNLTPSFIEKWLDEGSEFGIAFRSRFRALDSSLTISGNPQKGLPKESDGVALPRYLFPKAFSKFSDVIQIYDKLKNELINNHINVNDAINDCYNIKDIKDIKTAIKKYSLRRCKKIKKIIDLVKNYFRIAESYNESVDTNGEAIVSPRGFASRYLTPSKTIRVLLIDDKAEEEKKNRLTESNFPGFEFTPLYEKDNEWIKLEHDKFYKTIYDRLKKINEKKSFDAVLLDLCLGDSQGGDPCGYHLIPLIRGLMPNVPIIVYSQFDDMGHEKRAFDEGATWFLKKSEYKKLARHLNSIFSNPEWKSEWKAICDFNKSFYGNNKFNENNIFEFEDTKDEEFKKQIKNPKNTYLIYKALRTMPGSKIRIKRISGGYGGAMTIKAWKGDKDKSSPPVIVKLDSKFNTVMEYERYFRFIRPFLANECGRIENPAISIDNDHSVIVYTFAGKAGGQQEISSWKSLLEVDMESPDSCSDNKYSEILGRVLNKLLPLLHCYDVDDFGEISTFPNFAFGEVENKIECIDHNYVYRLPLAYNVKNFQFVPQESKDNSPFVFHGAWKKKGNIPATIELFNDKKRVILLSGDLANHTIHFRNHLVPGSRVWIKGDIGKLMVNEQVLNDALFKTNDNNNNEEEQGYKNILMIRQRSVFGELISSFYNSSMFPNINEDLLRHIKAGNWSFIMELANLLGVGNSESAIFKKLKEKKEEIYCRCGIVHGDLNLGNIMVESDADGFGDTWLIDFARTRRDFITYDFNVLFTSILGLLFNKKAWAEEGYSGETKYSDIIKERFADLVKEAVFRDNEGIPHCVPKDKRVRMIYSMLRQVRKAALTALSASAKGNPKLTYAYTTALMCFVTSRILLEHEKNAPAAAGMIVATLVCCENILETLNKES